MDVRTILVFALVGAVGGLIGGYVSNSLPVHTSEYDSGTSSMMFSVFGALVLAALVGSSTNDPPSQKR